MTGIILSPYQRDLLIEKEDTFSILDAIHINPTGAYYPKSGNIMLSVEVEFLEFLARIILNERSCIRTDEALKRGFGRLTEVSIGIIIKRLEKEQLIKVNEDFGYRRITLNYKHNH